jgi:hypothetical protein
MAASGFWRLANMNVARTAAGAAGNQLAGLAFGGATTYNTPLNSTEIFNAVTWSYTGNLNSPRQDIAGFGTSSAAMCCAGYTGSIYSNASEIFNGTVWTAGNSLNNLRSQLLGGGSTMSAFAVGGYNGTTTYNATEKFNGIVWSNAGNLVTARRMPAGGGNATSAFITAGAGNLASSEIYDGNIWATRGSISSGRVAPAGFGASGYSGLVTGGNDGAQNWLRTETFDGNVWTIAGSSPMTGSNTYQYRAVGSGDLTNGGIILGGDGGGGGGQTSTAGWFTSLQSYSWMTQPLTATGRYQHGQAGGTNQDVIVFGGTSLITTTERWNGISWAAGGGLSQGKNYPAGTGDAVTTALCIAGNNAGYLTRVEAYNGTNWSTLSGVLNTARDELAAAGNASAALCFGGYTGAASLVTESFNGTTWGAVNNLQTAKYQNNGCGSQGAAICVGGYGPVKRTELWGGVTWANSGDLNTANSQASLSGSSTSARIARGGTYLCISEVWTGSAWSASLVPNIGAAYVGCGPGGTSTGMLVTGGQINTVGTMQYPSEIYTGALPVIINLSGISFVASGSDLIQQGFAPPWIATGALTSPAKYIGPFIDEKYGGVLHSTVASLSTNQGIMSPFNLVGIPFVTTATLSAALHVTANLIATLPMLQFSALLAERSGRIRAFLPSLEFTSHGINGAVGRISADLPMLLFQSTGLTGAVGRLAGTIPSLILSATGWPVGVGKINLSLPMLRMLAHGGLLYPYYKAIAVNPHILGVTEYLDFPFNSFAYFNGVYLGASYAGIHRLVGGDDNGAGVDADFKLGKIPLDLNKVRDIWVQGRATGDLRASVSADEGLDSFFEEDYLLTVLGQDRAILPRGLKPVYIQVGVFNEDGADFDIDAIQIVGEAIQRKKR